MLLLLFVLEVCLIIWTAERVYHYTYCTSQPRSVALTLAITFLLLTCYNIFNLVQITKIMIK